MCRWLKVLFVVPVAILSMLSACDSTEPSDDARLTEQQSASGGETSATGGAAVDGEIPSEIQAMLDAQSDTWPDYIPADIPPLPDNIRKVMGESTHIRIFYHELSQGQIDEYLQLLQENGFQLQYVVYQDERYPDEKAAQKRIEEGDFDAVHITKDDYELQITYGGGETVMDISASGWEDANPFTPNRQWPADLADLPMPQDCRIEGVYPQDSGGYQIVCRPNDEEAAEDYYQALRATGYLPTDSPRRAIPPVAGDYQEVLSLGDTEITLECSASVSTFRLTVWRIAEGETTGTD